MYWENCKFDLCYSDLKASFPLGMLGAPPACVTFPVSLYRVWPLADFHLTRTRG